MVCLAQLVWAYVSGWYCDRKLLDQLCRVDYQKVVSE